MCVDPGVRHLSPKRRGGHLGHSPRLLDGVEEPELIDGDPEAILGIALQAVTPPRVKPAGLEPDDFEATPPYGGLCSGLLDVGVPIVSSH